MSRQRKGLVFWGAIASAWMIMLSVTTASATWNRSPIAPTMTPLQTPTPVSLGNVLFHDNFATYSNRWNQQESPKAWVRYRQSGLNVRVMTPGVSIWSVPNFDVALESYRVEVTANFYEGSPDSLFGVVLQYEDDESFYAIVVTHEGEWRFLRREADNWIELTPEDAASVEWNRDESLVHLRIDVEGSVFTLYVNDQVAGTVTGDEMLSGDLFGLIALSQKGYIDVMFDDIVVTDMTEER